MDADEALKLVDDLIRTAGEKPLNDLQRSIFRGAWLGKNYKEIWQECSQVSLDHIMRNVGPDLWQLLSRVATEQVGEPIRVRKEALKGPIERVRDRLPAPNAIASFAVDATGVSELGADVLVSFPAPDASLPALPDTFEFADFEWQPRSINRVQDWGTAPAASQFQGRTRELQTLCQWIEEDACRLVSLTGSAGIGKTDLSVKLTERLRDRFECVVWRSLDSVLGRQHPLTLTELLRDLLTVITGSADSVSLTTFMDCLRHHRCLIVLDGFEVVFQGQVLSGEYLPDYENYGDLLKRVGDTNHISCLVVTSREQPREIEAREGETAPVRAQALLGLAPNEVQSVFLAKGNFTATESDWRSLTHQYDGNPRFLQQVATTITRVFSRDVSRFLRFLNRKALLVSDIRDSLEHQISRLSHAELTLLESLSNHPEPVTLEDVQTMVQASIGAADFFDVLLSLVRRSLLPNRTLSYSLSPLVQAYLTQR